MNRIKKAGTLLAKAVAAGVLMASAGLAQALPFSAFEGRNADGSVNNACTATGLTKCALIYDSTLDITILNDWNIGRGFWSPIAAPGSAQKLAETAGFAATGLTGWRLPTGDFFEPAGSLDEFESIWNDVGGALAGLQSEFDGVQPLEYWSGSDDAPIPNFAWYFFTVNGNQGFDVENLQFFAVAVRPGDVVAAVPEPESLALVLVGLAAAGVARRRRPL